MRFYFLIFYILLSSSFALADISQALLQGIENDIQTLMYIKINANDPSIDGLTFCSRTGWSASKLHSNITLTRDILISQHSTSNSNSDFLGGLLLSRSLISSISDLCSHKAEPLYSELILGYLRVLVSTYLHINNGDSLVTNSILTSQLAWGALLTQNERETIKSPLESIKDYALDIISKARQLQQQHK